MARDCRARVGSSTVKPLRKALGLSYKQFANKIGVNPVTVSRWEKGTKMNSVGRKAVWIHFKNEILKIRRVLPKDDSALKEGPRRIINNQGRGVRIVIDILPL